MGRAALLLLALLGPARAEVYSYLPSGGGGTKTFTYDDQAASFGPALDYTGVDGFAVVPPPDVRGCAAWDKSAVTNHTCIALVQQGSCYFINKVVNAQEAGCVGVIVYSDSGDSLVTMGAPGNGSLARVPAVFVGQSSGTQILDQVLSVAPDLLKVSMADGLAWSVNLLVMAAAGAFIVSVICCRYCLSSSLRRSGSGPGPAGVPWGGRGGAVDNHRLQQGDVSKLRELVVQERGEGMCSICLDDYVPGDTLKVLPCRHAFHAQCVVPWLLEQQRVCPLCKALVSVTEYRDGDEPLMSASRTYASGGLPSLPDGAGDDAGGESGGVLDADQSTPLLS